MPVFPDGQIDGLEDEIHCRDHDEIHRDDFVGELIAEDGFERFWAIASGLVSDIPAIQPDVAAPVDADRAEEVHHQFEGQDPATVGDPRQIMAHENQRDHVALEAQEHEQGVLGDDDVDHGPGGKFRLVGADFGNEMDDVGERIGRVGKKQDEHDEHRATKAICGGGRGETATTASIKGISARKKFHPMWKCGFSDRRIQSSIEGSIQNIAYDCRIFLMASAAAFRTSGDSDSPVSFSKAGIASAAIGPMSPKALAASIFTRSLSVSSKACVSGLDGHFANHLVAHFDVQQSPETGDFQELVVAVETFLQVGNGVDGGRADFAQGVSRRCGGLAGSSSFSSLISAGTAAFGVGADGGQREFHFAAILGIGIFQFVDEGRHRGFGFRTRDD